MKKAIIALSVLVLLSIGLNIGLLKRSCVKTDELTNQRIVVIQNYLKLLGEGRYKEVVSFFTPDAVVSDAIKGLTTPAVYYNGLYAYLIKPQVSVYDIYLGISDKNVLAAHFNMKVDGKDGKVENRGQIVDLFVFAPNSIKFSKIYIQNNVTNYEFTH